MPDDAHAALDRRLSPTPLSNLAPLLHVALKPIALEGGAKRPSVSSAVKEQREMGARHLLSSFRFTNAIFHSSCFEIFGLPSLCIVPLSLHPQCRLGRA